MKTLCALAILLVPAMRLHAGVKLAEDGRALADVVIAADADKAARFGALDLVWHLKEMTGADFRIVTDDRPRERLEIRVGPSRRSKYHKVDFEGQRYVVEIAADGIDLCGLDKGDKTALDYRHTEKGIVLNGAPGYCEAQGTMYAVYDFLERTLGVEWFEQSDYGTRIPKRPTLEVEVAKAWREPFCLSRTGSWSGGGYNTVLWKGDEPGFRRYWDFAFGDKRHDARSAQTRLFLYRHRMGGVNRSANHSFYHFYDKYYKKGGKKFVEYRPDWFSKGTSDAALPAQLCYTNPEVIAQVVKEVREYFDSPDPRSRRWGEDQCCLEPMDNASFCLCDNCRKWYEPERGDENSAHSTYWFNFVNVVARELKKTHPDKRIATLAYMSHEGMPTGFRLEDNVTLWFCLFNNRLPFERGYERQFERMAEWRGAYPDLPLALWLYNTFPYEFAHLANFKTFPGYFSHFAADQYKLFRKVNARQGIYQCGIAGTLESWMQLELLQDADLTADELLDRWYSQYGAAAGAMRKFHDLCEERYCSRTIRPQGLSGICQESSWGHVGDEATMEKLAGFVAEADAQNLTLDERGRLELFKLDTWGYMREGSARYLTMTKTPYPHYRAVRIPAAGGDFGKVDWANLPVTNQPLYVSGTDRASPFTTAVRAAHDGKYLYLEIAHDLETAKLRPCQAISYWDDVELMFARQRAQPYRCWFVAPDGRWYAASWGEVDGRPHVVPKDLYGSKYRSDVSAPDKWVNRWIIPLTGLAAEPVRPGETVYLNAASTLGPQFSGPGTRFGVYTLTSHTFVHVPDRMASLTLESGLEGAFPPEVKTVGVVMPASILAKPKFDSVHAALTNAGYRVKLAPRMSFDKVAPAADRARDFEDVWLDPEVDLVLCARGGTGAEDVIKLVDWEKLRARPDRKVLGFSNITMIHNAMVRKGVGHPVSGSSMSHFTYAAGDTCEWLCRALAGAPQPAAKLKALKPGAFSGLPCGGHVGLVAKGVDTGWNCDWTGRVLFLERNASAVKERVRGELATVLGCAGLARAAGVVFGDLSIKGGTKADSDELKREFAAKSPVPVYEGYEYGHVPVSHAVDFRRVTAVTEDGTMTWK